MSKHITTVLSELRNELLNSRDNEIMMADEVLAGYIQDHNDHDAWRDKERQITRLAKAIDRMITKLDKWTKEAEAIENSCENFYGD